MNPSARSLLMVLTAASVSQALGIPIGASTRKFNGPGLRYKIGVTIQTGEIVWVNGPCPCGEWSDLWIARDVIIYELGDDEMILSDGGHNDGYEFFETPTGDHNEDQAMKANARARHETINSRFKAWKCFQNRWRHSLE